MSKNTNYIENNKILFISANSCSFRSIIATGMNIIPQTKDHSLKTATVFSLLIRFSSFPHT